jgi:hypothetical protein
MDTDKHRSKSEVRKSVFTLAICIFVYVFSYGVNSFFGGYWLVPERDGKDKYSFGLSITDAILWQPRFGHEALGDFDLAGILYTPLIKFDRKFIHPTMYLSDETFQKISSFRISQVHPHWRDEFLTKIKVAAVEDETNKILNCFFSYTGSDHPREIVEIKMKRVLAESLGASAPDGFTINTNEGFDQFFKTNYVYWTGKLLLKTNQNVTLQFPVQNFKGSTGNVVFYYQRSDHAIDSRNICSVELK